MKATNLERRGVEYPFQDPEVKEKIKATNLECRGVEYSAQDPEVQEKKKATVLERYGVENVMQNPEISQRQFDSAHRSKDYTLPSGRIVSIQGYEGCVLDHLFNIDKHSEDDVIFGSEKAKLPEIYYVFEGTRHKYEPDVFIISERSIIEVKSTWTYDGDGKQEEEYIKRKERVHAKLDATFTLGFNTLLVVYDKKQNIVHREHKKHPSPIQI